MTITFLSISLPCQEYNTRSLKTSEITPPKNQPSKQSSNVLNMKSKIRLERERESTKCVINIRKKGIGGQVVNSVVEIA